MPVAGRSISMSVSASSVSFDTSVPRRSFSPSPSPSPSLSLRVFSCEQPKAQNKPGTQIGIQLIRIAARSPTACCAWRGAEWVEAFAQERTAAKSDTREKHIGLVALTSACSRHTASPRPKTATATAPESVRGQGASKFSAQERSAKGGAERHQALT